MKNIYIILRVTLMMLLIVSVQSCKEKSDPFDDNTYLVSATREVTLTETNVNTLLNVIKAVYPGVSEIISDVEGGVIVYSITYNTSFKGEEVLASGLVAIPSKPGTYPVLSYQNGTNTLHSEAPSVNPFNTYYQILQCLASTGYVVMMADYLGFGVSEDMPHPYFHKESTVRSLVDMLYSLREFDEDIAKDIVISNEQFLLGYSQGGWATLAFLDALENEYGADFNVSAASCGAGAYDIAYFNSYVLGLAEYPMPVFLGYIANAYTEYDLFTNPLSDLFKDPYAGRIPLLYDGIHSSDQINAQLTNLVPQLFKADYITGHATSATYLSVRNAMAANSIEGWDSEVPLLFVHGTADDYVIPELSDMMHDEMLSAGTNPLTCTYVELEDLDHSEGVLPAGMAALSFFKLFRK
ncbi:MAG: alpha/beta fold hydrolase [Bacteroidales bacterium]|jgi:pimeloyl-ACP methyl ester carboxylesterase|nr:alpha/beta fold hydrolase [Bacteroidales bacterium]